MTGKWQVVEESPTGITRHESLYDAQCEAEEVAAELANRLADNDFAEIYAVEVAA